MNHQEVQQRSSTQMAKYVTGKLGIDSACHHSLSLLILTLSLTVRLSDRVYDKNLIWNRPTLKLPVTLS